MIIENHNGVVNMSNIDSLWGDIKSDVCHICGDATDVEYVDIQGAKPTCNTCIDKFGEDVPYNA